MSSRDLLQEFTHTPAAGGGSLCTHHEAQRFDPVGGAGLPELVQDRNVLQLVLEAVPADAVHRLLKMNCRESLKGCKECRDPYVRLPEHHDAEGDAQKPEELDHASQVHRGAADAGAHPDGEE